jgi:hypothetical protein
MRAEGDPERGVEAQEAAPTRSIPLRHVLVTLALVALAAGAVAAAWSSEDGRSYLGVRQTRAGAVDLSYDEVDQEPQGGMAKDFVKPISLVELEEGHEDREHGTHQIQLGHGGVEFGGSDQDFASLGEDSGEAKAFEYNDLSATGKAVRDNAPEMNANYMMAHTPKGEDGRNSTFFGTWHPHCRRTLSAAPSLARSAPPSGSAATLRGQWRQLILTYFARCSLPPAPPHRRPGANAAHQNRSNGESDQETQFR